MTRCLAIALGALMVALAASSTGLAQPVLQVQGVLQSVDCQANSFRLSMPDGQHAFQANRYTAVSAGGTSIGLCALNQYVGSTVTVSLTATDSQFVAGRIDIIQTATGAVPLVSGSGYGAPTNPPSPYSGYYTPSYPPYPYYYPPYYAAPYCYGPYPAAYYGSAFCYGPYAGYYPYAPYYYGPAFSVGIGLGFGPGYYRGPGRFHHYR
jgi:hypothetical protein